MSTNDVMVALRGEVVAAAEEKFERAARPLMELLGRNGHRPEKVSLREVQQGGAGRAPGRKMRYEDRIVDVLRHKSGLTAKEIARNTRIPLPAVRQSLYKNPHLLKVLVREKNERSEDARSVAFRLK